MCRIPLDGTHLGIAKTPTFTNCGDYETVTVRLDSRNCRESTVGSFINAHSWSAHAIEHH